MLNTIAKPVEADTILRCSCCGLPFARLQGGSLVVESRHHGEKHVNVIPLKHLKDIKPTS